MCYSKLLLHHCVIQCPQAPLVPATIILSFTIIRTDLSSRCTLVLVMYIVRKPNF